MGKRKNTVEGIGINDFGDYIIDENKKIIWQYRLWSNILLRCNGKDKCEGYRNNTIDVNWLYFSKFYDDINKVPFCERYKTHKYQLDKDILIVDKPHHYSKDSVCFIPQEINKILTLRKNDRGNHLLGVYYDKKSKKFRSQISKNGKRIILGWYDNPIDAHEIYCKEKDLHIHEIALNYKDEIDHKVFNKLVNFNIKEYISKYNR